MYESPSIRQKAFFDSTEAPDTSFWHKAKISHFEGHNKLLENSFYIRRSEMSSHWLNCTLTLFGQYIVCRMSKGDQKLEYIDLEEYLFRLDNIQVSKKSGERAELEGFSLYRNGLMIEFLCKKASVLQDWINELKRMCILAHIETNYRVLDPLGHGGYGKVCLIQEYSSKKLWAGKFIKMDPSKERKKQQVMAMNEIKILRKLDHPHIVKLHEVYEIDDEICIVLEFIKGERLFDVILKQRGLTEVQTAIVMKQLLSTLSYLQFQDVIHRDLKPENIMWVKKKTDEIEIVVVDFGLATYHTKRDIIKKGGTAGYVAPEILKNDNYDFKADLYSSAVIMFTCLSAKPLFAAPNYHEVMEKNKKGAVKFPGAAWTKVSSKAKDLLQRILEPRPSRRYSLNQAVDHGWFQAELPPQMLRELLETTFRFIQMDIPSEVGISDVPYSLGNIRSSGGGTRSLGNAFSIVTDSDNASCNKEPVGSLTAMPSYHYMGYSRDNQLGSFYKMQSRDSGLGDRTDTEQSQNDSRSTIGSNLFIFNRKTAAPINNTLISPINKKEDSFHHFGAGYNIHIHAIGSFPELDNVPIDEEMEACSASYRKLKTSDFCFNDLHVKQDQTRRLSTKITPRAAI